MGLSNFISQSFTYIAGFLFASFKLYEYYANIVSIQKKLKSGAADEKDKKNYRKFAAQDIALLSHFVSMVFFCTFTLFLDAIIGGSTIYNLIKILLIYYFIHNRYNGSRVFCSQFVVRLNDSCPFLLDFAKQANEGTIKSVFQYFITAVTESFFETYCRVLQEID